MVQFRNEDFGVDTLDEGRVKQYLAEYGKSEIHELDIDIQNELYNENFISNYEIEEFIVNKGYISTPVQKSDMIQHVMTMKKTPQSTIYKDYIRAIDKGRPIIVTLGKLKMKACT